jgi:hypothetical protein
MGTRQLLAERFVTACKEGRRLVASSLFAVLLVEVLLVVVLLVEVLLVAVLLAARRRSGRGAHCYRSTSSRVLSVCVGCCAGATVECERVSLPARVLPRSTNAPIAMNASDTATAMPTVTMMATSVSCRAGMVMVIGLSLRGVTFTLFTFTIMER